MDELRDLYQATILDHSKAPRNFREIEGSPYQADGHNPICGDKVHVSAELEDGRLTDIAFQGAACAICMASASLMTEKVRGQTLDEFNQVFHNFHELVAGSTEEVDSSTLGKLAVFSGVREYPMRVKCATLAWHTLRAALDEDNEVAKTE
ncbi:MAG: SUF system NifU family Fe-S cluster assembly protein [Myxococcota bacterium]|nr:SUF system NifU family Fe-S cluster assembly protein [Myxococcota bacterium]